MKNALSVVPKTRRARNNGKPGGVWLESGEVQYVSGN